ncbi:MAG: ATP-binding protein, partial [Silvanigrellaceae bacterium]|nr:ATP-binding protein [Silvanigrellaceae bacterium]
MPGKNSGNMLLRSTHANLLLQGILNVIDLPVELAEKVIKRYAETIKKNDLAFSLDMQESSLERYEFAVGTIALAMEDDEQAILARALLPMLQTMSSLKTGEGDLQFHFTGANRLGAVRLCIYARTWEVEFSRLQRPVSPLSFTEASLVPQSHASIYEEMKTILCPLASFEKTKLLILQGAPGLGKSHCVEQYFYQDAHKEHQIVAWLSGETEEAFLKDWEGLANQFRQLDTDKRQHSNEALIHHWCEEQLGQWLFIIDDMQVEMDWLSQYLPQKGGHVVMTTTKPYYSLPKEANVLSFSALSYEDSTLLLKAWLGKYWEASGFSKEEQAISYLSRALGGSPALLTQMALLVKKKRTSFDRLKAQFDSLETRGWLFRDTIFDQLEGRTFEDVVVKGFNQAFKHLQSLYPPISKEHLSQFIFFLKQEAAEIEKTGYVCIENEVIMQYWEAVLLSLDLTPQPKKLKEILKLLPFSYISENNNWIIALAGLHALELRQGPPIVFNSQRSFKEAEELINDAVERDLANIPSGVHLAMSLKDSQISMAEISILKVGKPLDFKVWRLPLVNPYFIPRLKLIEDIQQKLLNKENSGQTAKLILAAASGMGGIGKTELARHFITEPLLSSHYQRRFWFNATNDSQL